MMRRAVMALGRSTFAATAVAGVVVAVLCGAAWVRSYFAVVRLGVSTEHWEVSVVAEDGWVYAQGWEVIGGYGKSARLEYARERAWESRGSGGGLFGDFSGDGVTDEEKAARALRWGGPPVEGVVAVHFAWLVTAAAVTPGAWVLVRRRARGRVRVAEPDGGTGAREAMGRRAWGRWVAPIALRVSWVVLGLALLGWVESARCYIHWVEWDAGPADAAAWKVVATSKPGVAAMALSAYRQEPDAMWSSARPHVVRWERSWTSPYSRAHWGHGDRLRMFPGAEGRWIRDVRRDENFNEIVGPARGAAAQVPYWMLAGVAAVMPARAVWRRWRRGRRGKEGMCAKCGYDLRATPGRCPECGTVTEVAVWAGMRGQSRGAVGRPGEGR